MSMESLLMDTNKKIAAIDERKRMLSRIASEAQRMTDHLSKQRARLLDGESSHLSEDELIEWLKRVRSDVDLMIQTPMSAPRRGRGSW